MKITITLLGLLMVVHTLGQKTCRKEKQRTFYHVYNTSVEIKTYHCFNDVGDEFHCKKYKANDTVIDPYDAKKFCSLPSNETQLTRVFCESPAKVNLLTNTVVFADNSTCQYDKYHCEETIYRTSFWQNQSRCNLSLQQYKGEFDVWTVQNSTRYIKDRQISLILTQEDQFCGEKVWKTNYEGVMVSTADLNNSTYRNYSEIKKICKRANKSKLCEFMSHNLIPRMWYIYKYPTEVTVYTCHLSTSGSSCTVPENHLKLLDMCRKVCDSSYCTPKAKFCGKTYQIDVENDAFMNLPGCKYSEGFCKPFGMFWYYTNHCETVQEVYETWFCEWDICVNKKKHSSSKLILKREGKLCGANIWNTNQPGLVASEKKLAFYQSKSFVLEQQDRLNISWFHPEPEIGSVGILEKTKYYIMVAVAICVFGVTIKMTVCLVYSCKKMFLTKK